MLLMPHTSESLSAAVTQASLTRPHTHYKQTPEDPAVKIPPCAKNNTVPWYTVQYVLGGCLNCLNGSLHAPWRLCYYVHSVSSAFND